MSSAQSFPNPEFNVVLFGSCGPAHENLAMFPEATLPRSVTFTPVTANHSRKYPRCTQAPPPHMWTSAVPVPLVMAELLVNAQLLRTTVDTLLPPCIHKPPPPKDTNPAVDSETLNRALLFTK